MSGHYHQKPMKELYRPKDVMFALIGVICAIIAGFFCARLFTGWSGI